MHARILLLLPCFFWAACTSGQTFNDYTKLEIDTASNYGFFNFIQLRLHRGSNLTSSKTDWVADLYSNSGYTGIDLRIGFQTTGKFEWEQLLKYPQYGFGFSTYFYTERDVTDLLGQPSAVYAFGNLPFYRSKNEKFYLSFDPSTGLAYDLNGYDPEENPFNDAEGSDILFYFNFGLSGVHFLSERMDLNYGLNLIHFSNGRLRTPNLGVNMAGIDLGLRYYFNPVSRYTSTAYPDYQPQLRPGFQERYLPPHEDYSMWNVFWAVGMNSTTRDAFDEETGEPLNAQGPSYFASTLGFEWQRKYGRVASWGLGLDYHFDASLGEEYEGEASFWERSTIGFGPLHELYIERFSIFFQPSIIILGTKTAQDTRAGFFVRAGLRARITDQLFGHFALKTYSGAIADYVEWGVGYSFY